MLSDEGITEILKLHTVISSQNDISNNEEL